MRGYYRAVKRGDAWAVRIENLKSKNIFSYMMALFYRNVNFKALVYGSNPFLAMLNGGGFQEKYVPVPYKKEG